MVTFVAIAAPVVAVAAGTAGDDVITGGDVVAATIFAGDAAGPSGEKQPPDGPARITVQSHIP